MIDFINMAMNFVLGLLNFGLLYIIGQEKISLFKGVKNFTGRIIFLPNGGGTPCFWFYIQNEGLTKQNYCYIISDKEYYVTNPIPKGEECLPGETKDIKVEINEKLILNLESAKLLFLVNKWGKRQKIISKRNIKIAVKQYKEHAKKQ